MDKEFVRSYLLTNGKYFPERKIQELNEALESSSKDEYVVNVNFRNSTLFTLLYWFVPLFWWLDRFFVRDFFGGIVKAIVFPILTWVCFILASKGGVTSSMFQYAVWGLAISWIVWVIVDGFTIYGRVKNVNYRKVMTKLGKRVVVAKVGILPVLYLIMSVTVFIWGMTLKQSVSGKEEIILQSESKVNIDKENSNYDSGINSTTYYEHSCGENESDFMEEQITEYDSLPVYTPNNPEPLDYDRNLHPFESTSNPNVNTENTNPFTNSDSYGTAGGIGTGTGNGPTDGDLRIRISSPNYDDIEVSETCHIEFKLLVTPDGNVTKASVLYSKTNTSNTLLISKVRDRVMEVKYDKKKNADLEEVLYVVEINP